MRASKQPFSFIDSILSLIETRQTSDRIFLRSLFFICVFLLLAILFFLNDHYATNTPTAGGVLKEGIVGIPRFINPALAITRADQDTVALLYSGLMRSNEQGELVPHLAESVSLDESGRIYTIKMRSDRNFHDGTPITARDAIFTIKLIQDPDLKSPLRGNWTDVVITEVDEYTFSATLKEPYTPFIENFTVGIMPHHIWSKIPIDQLPFSNYNTEPVGSGQFALEDITRSESGLVEFYRLAPYLENANSNLSAVELHYFNDEQALIDALTEKEITSTAYLPTASTATFDTDASTIYTAPLPRIFGVFFNQNRSAALRDMAARKALSIAIERDVLIEKVLYGYGVPTTLPTLPNPDVVSLDSTETFGIEAAKKILQDGGWKQDENGFWKKTISDNEEILSITIKTSNVPLFDSLSTELETVWRTLGVEVNVEQYDQTDLVQSVIRPRDFEALLFGLDMNRTEDLYPFWHSSQKDDPGLNIAQYTNIAIDKLLEQARLPAALDSRATLKQEISTAISTEYPAVFLFAPEMVYITDNKLVVSPLTKINRPADRFMNIEHWYANTEKLWPIFHTESIESIN